MPVSPPKMSSNVFDIRTYNQWEAFLSSVGGDGNAHRNDFQEFFLASDSRYPSIVYPPPLFETAFLSKLTADTEKVLRILASVPDRIFEGDVARMLDFQSAPPLVRELVMLYSQPEDLQLAMCFARPDLLLSTPDTQIVEMNVGTALGGLGMCDRIFKEWQQSKYCDWLEHSGLSTFAQPMMLRWSEALKGCLRKSRNPSPTIFVAFVNAAEARRPAPYFWDFVTEVRREGFQVQFGLLQELDFSETFVRFAGETINVVYPMFTYAEIEKNSVPKELFELLRFAVDQNLIDFVGTPATMLFDHKGNLELLTAPEYEHYYDAAEWEILQRIVPKTYVMRPDRLDLAIRKQQELILKPSSSFGGDRIMIGKDISPVAWQEFIKAACVVSGSYVLQERAQLLSYPSATGSLDLILCISPMILSGCVSGFLLREMGYQHGSSVISAQFGARLGVGMSIASTDEK